MNNNKGSVLISAVVAIIAVIVILAGVLSMSLGSVNRAVASEERSQAYYTALSAINIFKDAIENSTALGTATIDLLESEPGSKASPTTITNNVGFTNDMGNCKVSGYYEVIVDEDFEKLKAEITLIASATTAKGHNYTMSITIDEWEVDSTTKVPGWKEIKIPKTMVNPIISEQSQTSFSVPASYSGETNTYYYLIQTDTTANGKVYFESSYPNANIVVFVGQIKPKQPDQPDHSVTIGHFSFGNCNQLFFSPNIKSVYFILAPGCTLDLGVNTWKENPNDSSYRNIKDVDIYVLNASSTNKGSVIASNKTTDGRLGKKIITSDTDALLEVSGFTYHDNVLNSLYSNTDYDLRKTPTHNPNKFDPLYYPLTDVETESIMIEVEVSLPAYSSKEREGKSGFKKGG